ncbi:AAA family ATPase [Spongiactinospora sp. TRM90649]|nr:ATP-binding domain-containing protein [Spongiactinospora sp. TRM90649]MDF5758139.1 AAA family ATPase [Spongiactinospora sp. TRM90649]
MLYGHLDDMRDTAEERLSRALRDGGMTGEPGESAQALVDRDAAATRYTRRLAQLDAAEHGLCFGRLDLIDGERYHIGRIGIHDDTGDDYEPLLLDWRAPAARPFYVATGASPHGVRRRRHIKTRKRTVTAISDETLDLTSADPEALTGEAALLAALTAGRTGRMSDIVETIQAEQDAIIRSPHRGVLVVQGGAGTGKTVVALHRAAYLLYTHRDLLSKRGVLIVGPNATFLRYIGEVLPSLGETGVLLATVGELFPGVTGDRREDPAVAEVKGRPEMARVLAEAVLDRQWVPEDRLEIVHDGQTLVLTREVCERVRSQVRATSLLHNEARPLVVKGVADVLTRQLAERLGEGIEGGHDLIDDEEFKAMRRELLEDNREIWAAIDLLWPVLTPQRLLTDLFASADRLAAAAPGLPGRELLERAPGGGWSAADVPLLDEAAEILGVDDRAARAAAEEERLRRVAYAQGVLDISEGSRSMDVDGHGDAEVLSAADLVDAERFAERHAGADDRSTAERAAADRTWTFGHVIVDEAQELSQMAWRMLMRRIPTRWMTLVGDIAQTGSPAGAASWREALAPYTGDRWSLTVLNVNYRMPAEVMAVAAGVLAELDPTLPVPRSVRETGESPWQAKSRDVAGIAAEEARLVGRGRLAVVVPSSRLDELSAEVLGGTAGAPDLAEPVVVLDVAGAKGLEFDSVIVVDPARIVAESVRGLNDLYVALTRTTRRLGVVHDGDLPGPLAGLPARA